MLNTRLNLFTRLYLAILMAVSLGILITKYAVDYYDTREDLRLFQHDMRFLQDYFAANPHVLDQAPGSFIPLPAPYNYHFQVYWQDQEQTQKPCASCLYQTRENNTVFYQLSVDTWHAVITYPDKKQQLHIKSILDERHPSGEFDIDIDHEFYPLLLLLGLLALLIALFIYWPVQQLQRQINQLINTNRAFGTGDLHVRASQQLSYPLNNLADSFNNMANSISQSVKENQIFSQAIPHEIRTPLSRIQMASALLDKLTTEPEHKALLQDVNTNIKDINHLISQVVTYCRLQLQQNSATGEQHKLHLLSFIHSRLQLLHTGNPIKVLLDVDEELQLRIDPILLRLLLDNLLKNAFIHASASIRIHCSQSSSGVELKVEDDGPGIAPEQYDNVFIPFCRLDQSRNQQTGGLGLGLSICKIASAKLNAQLYISTSTLGGASFHLCLPPS